jgi:CRP-like cAMP-binding protein
MPFSPNHARLIRKLESITDLTETDRQALAALPMTIKSLEAHQEIVREKDRPDWCTLLLDGFMHRHRMLPNGSRQIMSFHFPGDIVDLQSLYLGVMDHSVGTLAASRVAYIPQAALRALARERPAVDRALWRAALIEAAIFREWIVNIGRRSSYRRIAHLLCELYALMRSVGLAEGNSFTLPLTQLEIADATGITSVHVNRVFKELRAAGLVASEGRILRVTDCAALQKAASFDPAYLHLVAA